MKIKIADNSYAKIAEIIESNKKQYSVKIGDVVRLTIKDSQYGKFKKKKAALKFGVIIRVKKTICRNNNAYISFSDNAAILVNNKTDLVPLGTKVIGMVGAELLMQEKYENIVKIVSLQQFK